MKLNLEFVGIFLLLLVFGITVDGIDISDIKKFYDSFQSIRQCRSYEVQECLSHTWKHFTCKYKDNFIVSIGRANLDTYMATKCSMNLLLNNGLYTQNYGSNDKMVKPDDNFVATENLPSRAVGDEKSLSKVCFIQEIRKCLHEHHCAIRSHTSVFGQIYEINQSSWSQIYHTTAFYVKEKWQQLKDFLFG